MSKTSNYVPVRLPLSLSAQMDVEITRREDNPYYPPWTRSTFIQEAIREKIAHLRRSRKRRRKPRRTLAVAAKGNEGSSRL